MRRASGRNSAAAELMAYAASDQMPDLVSVWGQPGFIDEVIDAGRVVPAVYGGGQEASVSRACESASKAARKKSLRNPRQSFEDSTEKMASRRA